MKLILDRGSSRTHVQLGKKLGGGAIGDIYEVTGHPELVLKLYVDFSTRQVDLTLAASQEPRIAAMLRTAPKIGAPARDAAGSLFPQLAWPTHGARDSAGRFVGYAMPKLPLHRASDLEALLLPRSRSSSGLPQDWIFRFYVARNLSSLVRELHREGHFVIDMKPKNMSIYKGTSSPGTLALLDADGFSINAGTGHRLPGTHYTSEYISPELQGKSPAVGDEHHDRWALAVILFRLLNENIHPYQGRYQGADSPTIDDHVRANRYAYGLAANRQLLPSPASIHEFFDDDTRSMFDRAFGKKREDRPSAREWREHLDLFIGAAQTRLNRCRRDGDHWHFSKGCGLCFRADLMAGKKPQGPLVLRVLPVQAPAAPRAVQLAVQGRAATGAAPTGPATAPTRGLPSVLSRKSVGAVLLGGVLVLGFQFLAGRSASTMEAGALGSATTAPPAVKAVGITAATIAGANTWTEVYRAGNGSSSNAQIQAVDLRSVLRVGALLRYRTKNTSYGRDTVETMFANCSRSTRGADQTRMYSVYPNTLAGDELRTVCLFDTAVDRAATVKPELISALIPTPVFGGYVTDSFKMLPVADAAYLAARLELLVAAGVKARVIVIGTTGPESLEDFGARLSNTWNALGEDKKSDLLISVASKDRTVRVELTRNINARLSDQEVESLIATHFKPDAAKSGVSAGLRSLVDQLDRLFAAKSAAGANDADLRSKTGEAAAMMSTGVATWDGRQVVLSPAAQALVDSGKARLEAMPRPARGDRKLARQLHTVGMTLLGQAGFETLALEKLRQAHAADQLDVQIANDLAYVEQQLGHHREAVDYLLKTLRLAPTRTDAWAMLAESVPQIAAAPDTVGPVAVRTYTTAYWFSHDKAKTLEFLRAKASAKDLHEVVRASAAETLKQLQRLEAVSDKVGSTALAKGP